MNYQEFTGLLYADPQEVYETMRDSRGVMKTEALFEEVIQASSREKYEPLYSLRDYDNKGKPSAYQIYIHSVDEREAALKLVGSLAHWRKLCSLKWFINGRPEVGFEGLAQWRQDMADRDLTVAKQVLVDQCEAGSVPAARALEKMAKDSLKEASKVRSRRDKTGTEDSQDDVLEFLHNFKG